MTGKIEFVPKLFSSLKNYSREKFMSDLMAGIIVGIMALPLAIAFGIASGVSPEKGLITAIIGVLLFLFWEEAMCRSEGQPVLSLLLYMVLYRISGSKVLQSQRCWQALCWF